MAGLWKTVPFTIPTANSEFHVKTSSETSITYVEPSLPEERLELTK